MQKVELAKVLDLLIAEDRDEAGKLLHEWFVGKSKHILEELMQEDDGALDDINADKEEIEQEEFYSDADLSEDDEDGEIGDEVADEVGAEGDELDAAADDIGDEIGAEVDAEVSIDDKVDDLEAQLATLKAEFDKIMGGEGEEEIEGEVAGDLEADADDQFGGEEVVGDDEFAAESVFESDDEELDEDFQDLEESFELEKVKDPDMSEGSEAGNGSKQAVDKSSPIPQRKTEDRVGGAVVEIKGKTHKGYARETSPGVNAKPILKNQVSNAKQDLVPVSPEGDKSALINKGPKPDKGKSPIGGGAVDLRGNDMKRK